MNSDAIFLEKGNPIGQPIEAIKTVDYLTDFLRLTKGEEAVLPMSDVFSSSRVTLEIQKLADLND